MEGSDTYRFPKLKGSDNYESWGVDVTSALKAKGLWWITSGKLGKPEIPESKAATAAKREYASAINHWKDKNDRACGVINFSIEQRLRVHIVKIQDATIMWSTLKTQYEQSNLTTLHLAIRELTRSEQGGHSEQSCWYLNPKLLQKDESLVRKRRIEPKKARTKPTPEEALEPG